MLEDRDPDTGSVKALFPETLTTYNIKIRTKV